MNPGYSVVYQNVLQFTCRTSKAQARHQLWTFERKHACNLYQLGEYLLELVTQFLREDTVHPLRAYARRIFACI